MNGMWLLVIVPVVALALGLAWVRYLESGSRRWCKPSGEKR
jgi:hypothetical protein